VTRQFLLWFFSTSFNLLAVAEKPGLQAAQKDLRGEAREK
jgi:hypothetical protein